MKLTEFSVVYKKDGSPYFNVAELLEAIDNEAAILITEDRHETARQLLWTRDWMQQLLYLAALSNA